MNHRHLPIGIFDSGIGGLTVVREIQRMLPHEDLLYLGDTARVPYGTKSPSTVIRFASEDTQFLIGFTQLAPGLAAAGRREAGLGDTGRARAGEVH